jgi:hypothetical protein
VLNFQTRVIFVDFVSLNMRKAVAPGPFSGDFSRLSLGGSSCRLYTPKAAFLPPPHRHTIPLFHFPLLAPLSIIKPSFHWKHKTSLSSLAKLSLPLGPAATMSGLYSQGFSPARTASPQIRGNPDHDRYSAARDLFSRSFSVILDPEVALCSLCLPLSIDAILGFYAVSTWLSFSRSIKSWGPSCRCCPCAAGC